MSIKTKSKKQYCGNNSITLDKAHKKKMEDFENIKNKIPKKKAELVKLEKQLNSYNKIKSINLSDDGITKKAELMFKIEKFKQEINDIENEDSLVEYFWKAGDHLVNYYKLNGESYVGHSNKENVDLENQYDLHEKKKKKDPSLLTKLNISLKSEKVKKPSTRKIKVKISNSHNIIGFFNNKNIKVCPDKSKTDKETPDTDSIKHSSSSLNTKLLVKGSKIKNTKSEKSEKDEKSEKNAKGKSVTSDALKKSKHSKDAEESTEEDEADEVDEEGSDPESDTESVVNKPKIIKDKAKLNDLYHQLTDSKYSSKYKSYKQTKVCHGIDMILDKTDGLYLCKKCGRTQKVIIDGDRHNYKEQVPEPIGCPYKKLNHLNEHLAQIQAKETTDIKPKTYLDIKAEMKKRKMSVKQLNYDSLRNILKKLGYNKLFEHIPYILFKITGKLPPQMTREMEGEIRKLFKQTLSLYEKYKLKGRTNYFKYPYAIYKFCQLLDYDEYLPATKSLFTFKNKKNLIRQDKIWEKICIDLDWDFYNSEL